MAEQRFCKATVAGSIPALGFWPGSSEDRAASFYLASRRFDSCPGLYLPPTALVAFVNFGRVRWAEDLKKWGFDRTLPQWGASPALN